MRVDTYDASNRLTRIDPPTATGDQLGQLYVHRGYDANGRLLFSSRPVSTSSAGSVTNDQKSLLTYFDPGWIRTSKEPGDPLVHFDYRAEGWQLERVPEFSPAEIASNAALAGQVDTSKKSSWTYFDDGVLLSIADPTGQKSVYAYDAHTQLISARTVQGGATTMEVEVTYDTLDRTTKARKQDTRLDVDFHYTKFVSYDLDGNLTKREDDGTETSGNVPVQGGRPSEFSYDGADWLSSQLDYGADKTKNTSDDQTIATSFTNNHWLAQRTVTVGGTQQQKLVRTHFADGLLKQQTTYGQGTDVLEDHTRRVSTCRRPRARTTTTAWACASACSAPTGGPSNQYFYGHDAHASISLLTTTAGAAQAAYGCTPYGTPDLDLTQGDANEQTLTNPYRYTGKWFDPASGTLDMGFRRFGADLGRFLQQDLFYGALRNLRLSLDPLTTNRYGLAGANPTNFIEVDGHQALPVGADLSAGLYSVDDSSDWDTEALFWGDYDFSRFGNGSLADQGSDNKGTWDCIRPDSVFCCGPGVPQQGPAGSVVLTWAPLKDVFNPFGGAGTEDLIDLADISLSRIAARRSFNERERPAPKIAVGVLWPHGRPCAGVIAITSRGVSVGVDVAASVACGRTGGGRRGLLHGRPCDPGLTAGAPVASLMRRPSASTYRAPSPCTSR